MKRINIFTLIAVAVTTLCVSMVTIAGVPVPFGWYLDGGVGYTKVSSISYGRGTSVSSGGPSVAIDGGYKFNPYFGAELGYTKYAEAKIKSSINATYIKNKMVSYDIAAKGILPIMDSGFNLFSKIGWSLIHSATSGSVTSSHNATGLYVGFGGGYTFMPCMDVHVQWNRAFGDGRTGNLDFYSAGVGYLFG